MLTQYLYDIHNYLHILIYIQKKLAFAFIIVYLCRKIFSTLAIRTACRLGTWYVEPTCSVFLTNTLF